MLHLDIVPHARNFSGAFTFILLAIFLTFISELITPAAYGQPENENSNFHLDYSVLSSFDYNRVDGVFPGLQAILTNDLFLNSSFRTRLGYGFKSKDWQYSLSVDHAFDLLNTKSISLSIFDETRSNDRVILSQPENILSTALLRKDYRDYFVMHGFETQLNLKFKQYFSTIFNFRAGTYKSLPNLEPWSLFSLDDFFRTNPTIDGGDELLTSITLQYDSRDLYFIESNYWNVELKYEHEYQDYEFDGIHFLIERLQLGWGRQTLIANFRGGFRSGTAAEQYLMDLGGIGTLRGYEFKEFTGSRMIRFEGNYLFNGDLLQKIPLQFIPFYSSLSTGVFFDAGMTWFGNDNRIRLSQGPSTFQNTATGSKIKDVKSDLGVSFLLLDGTGKIDIARRLDRRKDAWKITFRFRLFQFF